MRPVPFALLISVAFVYVLTSAYNTGGETWAINLDIFVWMALGMCMCLSTSYAISKRGPWIVLWVAAALVSISAVVFAPVLLSANAVTFPDVMSHVRWYTAMFAGFGCLFGGYAGWVQNRRESNSIRRA